MTPKLFLVASVATALLGCSEAFRNPLDDLDQIPVTYLDADGDTILDHHEGLPEDDADGDGTPNYLDTDSDGDGVGDDVEAGDADPLTLPKDTDLDTVPNFLDDDADGNCIPDAVEGGADLDGDGVPDLSDPDDDADGILDTYEIGEGCQRPDSDGDGKPDYHDLDSDGDGIGDVYEAGGNGYAQEPADTDADGVPDYLDLDSDGDGLSDAQEGGVTGPTDVPRDSDGDGFYDFADTDSDADGLRDDEEVALGLDPYRSDTDGDGYADGAEIAAGSDPLDASSVVEGIYVVVPERSDVEERFEFTLSIQMGDIGFLLDSTGSMGGTLSAMAAEFSTIVSQLTAIIPDANYGVATYDDYAYGSLGSSSSGDRPFILRQQITSDSSRVRTTLSGLGTHYGGDAPESSMEAIYQALVGKGYDQNCNGSYDSSTDVAPFIANASDAFAGRQSGVWSSSSPGGGTTGGMGFRDYALPVIVYATDANLRDSQGGYETPGGCLLDAGKSHVVGAASGLGAYLIGIAVNNSPGYNQMLDLAAATGSYADTDHDGVADDALVFKWSGSNSQFRDTIVQAVQDLVSSVRIDEVSLSVEGDQWGFVVDVDPAVVNVSGAPNGQTIDFTLTFRGTVAQTVQDQLYKLTLNVVGDGTILLDTLDIYVLVPGA